MSNTQLGTCVLEVALCLSQQLLDDSKADGSSYSVGESVMARRLDGEFGEGTVLDALGDGSYLVVWNEEEAPPLWKSGHEAGGRAKAVVSSVLLTAGGGGGKW